MCRIDLGRSTQVKHAVVAWGAAQLCGLLDLLYVCAL
jgi:hypothetical protein